MLGLPGRIPPATAALFYVDPADPEAGGTGHTIRVSRQQGIPLCTQSLVTNYPEGLMGEQIDPTNPPCWLSRRGTF